MKGFEALRDLLDKLKGECNCPKCRQEPPEDQALRGKLRRMDRDLYFSETEIGGCGPLALRQVTPESVTDAQIMSACLHHGYDAKLGGINAASLKDAARDLGINVTLKCLCPQHAPGWGHVDVRKAAEISGKKKATYWVGVDFPPGVGHVLVVRNGTVLDCSKVPLDTEVNVLGKVMNDGGENAKT